MNKFTRKFITAGCKSLCDSSGKIEGRCAAICMQYPGDIPKTGCSYAINVWGKKFTKAFMAAMRVVAEQEILVLNQAEEVQIAKRLLNMMEEEDEQQDEK